MRRSLLLLFALAACATPEPPAPEATVCRDADGQVMRADPKIGSQTGLPVPRSIYTSRGTTFRTGPKTEETALFTLERHSAVMILRECEFYRLARLPDGRTGWLPASALTTRAPKASP